jgi:hypothetical protein
MFRDLLTMIAYYSPFLLSSLSEKYIERCRIS